jgi:hypothetical protein
MNQELATVTYNDDLYDYHYLRGEDAIYEFITGRSIGLKKLIGFDIETYPRAKYVDDPRAGLVPQMSKIRTMQIFDGAECFILDLMEEDGGYLLTDPKLVGYIRDFLLSKKLVSHFAAFETGMLQWLFTAHFGKVQPLNILCTMNLFRLLLHAQTDKTKGVKAALGNVAYMVLGTPLDKEEQRSDWSKPQLEKSQIDYCALDAIIPHLLVTRMIPKLEELEMEQVYLLNTRAQEPVAHMRIHGIGIDKEKHEKLTVKWKAKKDELWFELLEEFNKEKSFKASEVILTGIKPELWQILLDRLEHLAPINTIKKLALATEALEQSLVGEEMWLMTTDAKGNPKRMKNLQYSTVRKAIKNIETFLVNPDSNPQKSAWLKNNLDAITLKQWPRSESIGKNNGEKSGQLLMDADTLELFPEVPIISKLSEYAKFAKLYSTYGEGFRGHILEQEKDGQKFAVIFPSFTLCYTGTGRMSSFDPNMQNLPRDVEVRSLFVARAPDRKLLVADFSQIELRVAAELSQDPVMLEAYEKGLDLHKITAAAMAGISLDEVTKEQRQAAKGVNFGLLYGAGATTLRKYVKKSYRVELSQKQAEKAVEAFRTTYPVYRKWQTTTASHAEESCQVRTPLGKVRRLPEDGTYSASMNTRVQGGAAEVMLLALTKIWSELQKRKDIDAYIVNVVHDELLTDCADGDVYEVVEIVETGMQEAMLEIFPEACIRGIAEAGLGQNWAVAKIEMVCDVCGSGKMGTYWNAKPCRFKAGCKGRYIIKPKF